MKMPHQTLLTTKLTPFWGEDHLPKLKSRGTKKDQIKVEGLKW